MPPSVFSSRACLLDLSQPIGMRTHAAFFLRTDGSEEAVLAIMEALVQREDSVLMRHELAYILGQMQNPIACPTLVSILEDETDDVIVRHEAAEALGALRQSDSLPILRRYCDHPAREIRETCQLAVDLIEWSERGEQTPKSTYLSVDPAPAMMGVDRIEDLKHTLLDPSKSLFHRYRAMFTLRDLNTDAAALALVAGFQDESALFRHEIAYVLGQMQRPVTKEGLIGALKNNQEHRMVRHEAAEALGAIGGDDVEEVLQQYREDEEAIVKDSCDVALDTMDYWSQTNEEHLETKEMKDVTLVTQISGYHLL